MKQERLRIERDNVRLSIGRVYDAAVHGSVSSATRSEIKSFSAKSRQRLYKYLRSCIAKYQYMGTITVREYSLDGRTFKRHLDDFLRAQLGWMRENNESLHFTDRHPESIFWFLEFQQRGAPHVHTFYTHPVAWQKLAFKWSQVVGDPSIYKTATKFEKLRAGRAGTISYARKYAVKESQKVVPDNYTNVGRFWGVRGFRECLSAAKSLKSSQAIDFAREDLWKAVKDCQKAGKVYVTPWTNGKGITVNAKAGVTLSDLGLLQMADRAMLMDSDIRMGNLVWLNRER